jgi:histidinol dehydrogenase
LADHTADAALVSAQVRHRGSLFVDAQAAEMPGDYGAGPNCALPTGGLARSTGGLSVLTSLRVRTWLRIDHSRGVAEPYAGAMSLAWLKTPEAHARSAVARRPGLGSGGPQADTGTPTWRDAATLSAPEINGAK